MSEGTIMRQNIIYLHGFASSPTSKKAQYFKQRLAEMSIPLQVPDLNVPSFEELTLTAMLEKVAEVVRMSPPGPVYLIGSSMGALVGLHFVSQYKDQEAKRAEVMVMLAPALDFVANRVSTLGEDGITQWQQDGWATVHNYATNTPQRIHYGLLEDIRRYDSYAADLVIPTLIYHGKHDDSVPVEQSERFAETRSNVTLKVVNSDHALLDQLDVIWADMRKFFAL